MRLTATASASYLKGRGDVGDSYRVGATGFYRLDRRWTIRAGVDYAKFPSAFSRGNGVSFNIGIVFQPDYRRRADVDARSEEHTSELQSLMRISYAVFCLTKKKTHTKQYNIS